MADWRTYHDRHRVIVQAQKLARSGAHADHRTILPLLQHVEGFEVARVRLEEGAIRLQLDRLCASARDPSTTRLDLAALRESQRTAKAASPQKHRQQRQ